MRPLPILVCLLLAGCAAGGAAGGAVRKEGARTLAPPTEADHRAVAAIRDAAPAILERQAEALWEAWIGGAPVDPGALEVGAAVVDGAALASIRRVRAAAQAPGERRALLRLERWVAGELLARAAAPASLRITEAEAAATFAWEGAARPFAEVAPLLAAEPDAARRAAIHQAAGAVLAQLAPLLEERDRAVEEAARGLGFASAVEAAAFLRGAPPAAIRARAEAVLDATDSLLAEALDPIVRMQLGLGVEDLRRSDAPRLLFGLRVASRIDGDPIAALDAALAALGLSLDGVRREVGPTLRPLALAVDPPDDVRLALPARTRQWEPVFREAGAALHAAHLRPGPIEQRLADGAVAHAFASIFAGLVSDTGWLGAHTALTAAEAEAHASAAAARALLEVRRHAGRLLAATEGDDEAAMERAWGHPLAAADVAWLRRDRDVWLDGDEVLRGSVLAAMLEEHLIERHGAAWWQEPAAGAELRRLWVESAGATVEEIAAAIGADGLDAGALARRLEARFAPARERVQRILERTPAADTGA